MLFSFAAMAPTPTLPRKRERGAPCSTGAFPPNRDALTAGLLRSARIGASADVCRLAMTNSGEDVFSFAAMAPTPTLPRKRERGRAVLDRCVSAKP